MPSIQIIDNYSITNKNPNEMKLVYPHLFKEVQKHDKVTSSSWYELSEVAFGEYEKWKKRGLRKSDIQEALFAIGKKKCPHCHKIKLLSDFGNNKNNPHGLMRECRECRTELHIKFYNNPVGREKHRQYVREYMRDYTKRIPVLVRHLKKLFEENSASVEEFFKTDLIQDLLKNKGFSQNK
jgi:hypothetical protein